MNHFSAATNGSSTNKATVRSDTSQKTCAEIASTGMDATARCTLTRASQAAGAKRRDIPGGPGAAHRRWVVLRRRGRQDGGRGTRPTGNHGGQEGRLSGPYFPFGGGDSMGGALIHVTSPW